MGAGHDGAADELIRRLRGLGFAVDRHDFLDLLPGAFGARLRASYRRQLSAAPSSWGWFFEVESRPAVARATAALTALADGAVLRAVGPDAAAVVSTYPLASQVLGRLRRTQRLRSPAITYLTDMSVHPMWVADGVDTHLAIHEVAARQAKSLGAADVRVIAPAVRPAFSRRPAPAGGPAFPVPRSPELPEGKPLALIVAGAWGVGAVEQTSLDIAVTGLAVPVVACGRNDALYRRFAGTDHAIALGWVDDMAALMQTCQFVVQNAGGLSSLEALAGGVPVLTYRCLPGHGQSNAEALERAGWVPWVRTFAELPAALDGVGRLEAPRIDLAAETPDQVIQAIAALHRYP
jgi:UDP-N-acetylglucosamine:LPS N-acetylglucosamine transferase